MKHFHSMSCLLLAATVMFSSCLKNDDDDVTLYSDAVITQFTLGNLTQYKPNSDSVVATLTGTNYKMAIDQLTFNIYNTDSLPIGTRINSVLCTVSAKNSGIISVKSPDAELYTLHNSESPIDFSLAEPRIFRVFSTDGTYHRDYKVRLNVKTHSSVFEWNTTAVADTSLLKGFAGMRLMANDSALVAIGERGGKTLVCYSKPNGKKWELFASKVFSVNAWKSAVVKKDTFFLLSNDSLMRSVKGSEWELVAQPTNLRRLIAAGSRQLVALTADSLLAASTDGITWKTEQFDTLVFNNPAKNTDSIKHMLALDSIGGIGYAMNATMDYFLFVGSKKEGTSLKPVAWRKVSELENKVENGRWINIPAEDFNKYLLQTLVSPTLVNYDSSIIAFAADGKVMTTTDQGLTWRTTTSYDPPANAQSVCVDKQGRMWAVSSNGKVWYGQKY